MSGDPRSDRKTKFRAWREAQRAQARDAFPLPDERLMHFFDQLDVLWTTTGCFHDLRSSEAVAASMGLKAVEVDALFDWCNSHGGFCDCEIAANTRDYWESNRERAKVGNNRTSYSAGDPP